MIRFQGRTHVKIKSFVSCVAAIALVVPGAVCAKEHRITLPDGSIRVINTFKQGGIITPSTMVVTVDYCQQNDGSMNCELERLEILEGRSAAETVINSIANAVGGVASAAVLRPTRIEETTNVSNGSASTSSPNITSSSNASPTVTSTLRNDSYTSSDSESYAENDVDNSIEADVEAYADNYSPTTVATDDALVDSLNDYDYSNYNSNNTNNSFNESTTYSGSGFPPIPPPPPPPPPPSWNGKG